MYVTKYLNIKKILHPPKNKKHLDIYGKTALKRQLREF